MEKAGKTVSVIVPVYNAADVLPRIVNQLKEQTLKDMEILLIDDCSTDGSGELALRYEKQDPEHFRCFKTEKNSGPGGARNVGLEQAQGEYIGFVDADDEIVTTMFQKLYEKAKEIDADIVDSGYYNEKLDYAMLDTSDELAGRLDAYKRSMLIVSGGYIVCKIFKRSFLEEQGLRFRERVSLEDSEFITKTFATAEIIGNVKEILYKYTFTDVSASRERDWRQYYDNVVSAMAANYRAVKDLPYYEDIREAVEYLLIQLYVYGVLKCLSVCPQEDRDEITEKLCRIRKIRMETVTGEYAANHYIQQKIPTEDIQVISLNDLEPEKLIEIVANE